jgi:hypothetical protein
MQSRQIQQFERSRSLNTTSCGALPSAAAALGHFKWDGAILLGKTPAGRATIAVLNINAPHRIELREMLIAGEVFPPE